MKLFQLHYSSSKTKPATAKNDSVDKFLNGQKRERLSFTRDLRNRASFHQRQTVLHVCNRLCIVPRKRIAYVKVSSARPV